MCNKLHLLVPCLIIYFIIYFFICIITSFILTTPLLFSFIYEILFFRSFEDFSSENLHKCFDEEFVKNYNRGKDTCSKMLKVFYKKFILWCWLSIDWLYWLSSYNYKKKNHEIKVWSRKIKNKWQNNKKLKLAIIDEMRILNLMLIEIY